MKLRGILLGAALLAVPAGVVAAPVDCEPARCAVQAAIDQECQCDAATNHGRYVSCVAHVVKRLASDESIPVNCKGKIKRCAARSTCGKTGFVTCRFATDTCNLTAGTCTADPNLACTVDLDCGSRCRTRRSGEQCEAQGGTVGGTGTCCAACVTPPPAG
jgi:hypothetical protein